MKKIIMLLFIFQTIMISAITVDHLAPGSFFDNEKAEIKLEIRNGFTDVKKVDLYFRKTGEINFVSAEMAEGSETDPFFTYIITNLETYNTGLEYYFEITDNSENIGTYPEIDPQNSLFRIGVIPAKKVSGDFILLSPDPDIAPESESIMIAISLFALSGELKENSIKFIFDDNDVTSQTTKSNNMLIYKVKNTSPGDHSFQVFAEKTNGEKIRSQKWSHTVPGLVKIDNFLYSGDITVASRIRKTKSDSGDLDYDNHNLLLNLRGRYKKLRMRSRLYISTNEESDEQAVNRYNIMLAIPHLEIIGGDHTPNFDKFTANGKNIRGIQTNILFKSWRIYTSFGAIYRNIDGKVDSTNAGQDITTYTSGTFKRNSLATRIELGTKELFQFGLGFSKTKDNISSLNKKYYISQTDELPIVTPKDNIVIATDVRLALSNQKFVLGMDWAISLYNDNIIGGALDSDSLEALFDEEIPIDPESYENIIVLNKNISPIIPNKSCLAYNIYFKWNLKNNLFNISYSAIGASFNSLAVNYLAKDTSILSIFDNIRLLNNRLVLSLGFNLISDNINDEKSVTSKSTNFFTQIMYRPHDLPYFSFGD